MGVDRPYRPYDLATKSEVKIAEQILDRFYRDAEGKTNRQVDVYYALEDMGVPRDKADPALKFLVSRGLINTFGPDIAFLTDRGVEAMIEEQDIGKLDKVLKDFIQKPVEPSPAPVAAAPNGSRPEKAGSARPKVPSLTHIDLEGQEFTLSLGWVCTIGRAEGNHVRVNDQRASKMHAEIRFEEGKYVLHDLESANGTLLNGQYVVEPETLKHDDEVVIGRTMLLYTAPEQYAEPTTPPPSGGQAVEEPETIVPLAPTERPAQVEAQAIRVVKGTPAPPPVAPSQSSDLFREPARDERPGVGSVTRSDIFDDADRPGSTARAGDASNFDTRSDRSPPSDDLFGGAPPSASVPGDDLFREAPRSKSVPGDDLFRDEPRAGSTPDDLFAGDRGASSSRPDGAPPDDLFGDGPATRAPSARGDDLFGDGPATRSPSARGDDLFGGPASPPASDLFGDDARTEAGDADLFGSSAPVAPGADLFGGDADPLRERAPADARSDGDARTGSGARIEAPSTAPSRRSPDLFGEPPTVAATEDVDAEVPVVPLAEMAHIPSAPPGSLEEISDDESDTPPSTDAWQEDTPADAQALLENQPVVPPGPDAPVDAAATVMMTRDAIFGADEAEPPRWGDEGAPLGSHPGFAAEAGEAMPVASPSLANLAVPETADVGVPEDQAATADAELPRDSQFHETLEHLRLQTEKADLPDRRALLDAIDLLDRHPYVRVVLQKSSS